MEDLLATREVEASPAKRRCLGSLVLLHAGISEVLNASQPLRAVEIMIEKCAGAIMRGIMLDEAQREVVAEKVAIAASHVYEIEADLALSIWKRAIL